MKKTAWALFKAHNKKLAVKDWEIVVQSGKSLSKVTKLKKIIAVKHFADDKEVLLRNPRDWIHIVKDNFEAKWCKDDPNQIEKMTEFLNDTKYEANV